MSNLFFLNRQRNFRLRRKISSSVSTGKFPYPSPPENVLIRLHRKISSSVSTGKFPYPSPTENVLIRLHRKISVLSLLENFHIRLQRKIKKIFVFFGQNNGQRNIFWAAKIVLKTTLQGQNVGGIMFPGPVSGGKKSKISGIFWRKRTFR